MGRIFGHHPPEDSKEKNENEPQEQEDETTKKESKMDDFGDYLGDDEQLEEEGKTYGGMM